MCSSSLEGKIKLPPQSDATRLTRGIPVQLASKDSKNILKEPTESQIDVNSSADNNDSF